MSKNAIFFTSSIGDTDLAKETIKSLLTHNIESKYYLCPLTEVAAKRVADFQSASEQIVILSKDVFVSSNEIPNTVCIDEFIQEHKVETAYVGVPSNNATIAYRIASELKIPCILANEYMYKDPKHAFWNEIQALKEHIEIAVPLSNAEEEIHAINDKVKCFTIGHLSIDSAMKYQPIEVDVKSKIGALLSLNKDSEYVYVSGTSQPIGPDQDLVEALLSELSTNAYPHLTLRFGIHPGVADKDNYLAGLLEVCNKYPQLANQFKIILPKNIEDSLTTVKNTESDFILRANVSGPDAESIADRVTQSAAGAAVNKAVLLGLPTYCPFKDAKPYLPSGWSANVKDFLNAKPRPKLCNNDLGLSEETAGQRLAKRFM